MKLKYYLRGLGIGIIVTTVILTVRFSFYKPKITDEEVMTRAAQLGMVMPEENIIAEDTQETEEKQENTETTEIIRETEQSTETAATEEWAEPESVSFTVNPGDVCRTVCNNLFESGLIEDAGVFETFLAGKKFSDSIIAGTYEIPYGASYEEVYQILRSGPW